MKSLDVRYDDNIVGELSQDDSGKMSFRYDNKWIVVGFPISMSLPLQKESFTEKECRPFFEGLLPEGIIRDEIARNLGVSSRSDFALLKAIGGDCAGAISVGSSTQISSEKYEELIEGQRLLDALKPLTGKPLFAGEKDVRLSIAGSQRKLPIIYRDSRFYLPHGDIPTTAIIKPEIPGIDGSIENEFFCLSLAKKMSLPVPKFEILKLDRKYLVIERYDRVKKDEKIVRLHQEDLCQATGIPSENKYQKDGGPGFKDLFAIIRKHSSQPALDIRNAVRIAIFNYIIGNADAHGKNFSFLIEKDSVRLAPFYDLLSTRVYPNLSQKMAMKIGNKYEPDAVFSRHWHMFAEDISVNPEFVEKEIKYVSNSFKKYAESVAKSCFSKSEIPDVVNRIVEQILREEILST